MVSTQYRVVLDTNQIIAAGSSWLELGKPPPNANVHLRVLCRVADAHIGLFSAKVVAEYAEKLVDRNHPKERVAKLLTYIMGAFTKVTIATDRAPFPPSDPDDEVFLLCAIDGNADYLVSDDRALTGLSSKYPKPVIGRCEALANSLGA